MRLKHHEKLKEAFGRYETDERWPGSFWMKRTKWPGDFFLCLSRKSPKVGLGIDAREMER